MNPEPPGISAISHLSDMDKLAVVCDICKQRGMKDAQSSTIKPLKQEEEVVIMSPLLNTLGSTFSELKDFTYILQSAYKEGLVQGKQPLTEEMDHA